VIRVFNYARILARMDIVFCGTPQFAVPALERLATSGFHVRLVVTQPERPSGRGLELAVSPVKRSALSLGLPVSQPDKIRSNLEFQAQLQSIRPRAIVVVGYGKLIPQWMLDLPPLGNINLHASLLPKYRGAAPIQWAIANGEIGSGNTTMRLDSGLDTGDILLQQPLPIAPDDTALTYSPRLADAGADLLVQTLRGLEQGDITPRAQDHAQATLAPILRKDDGHVRFSQTAREIHNRWRGFQPWPGIFTEFRGLQVKIVAAEPAAVEAGLTLSEGEVAPRPESLWIGCGMRTVLAVSELQPQGKRRMTARDFINGYRLVGGEKLG
jgi:methionyl-tRNA formyltransferase